jgi:hypothetical protein
MGTWGPGPFDSDDAYDVIDEFTASPTVQVVEDILKFVLTPGYDGVEWQQALAAAEIVAIMAGRPAVKRDPHHKDVIRLIRKHKLVATQDLLSTAIQVCQHALQRAEVENWRKLFGLPESYEAWRQAVRDLEGRLEEERHA